MVICPRCERPLSHGHRCLSRRHFFFGLAGSAALAAAGWPFSQRVRLRPGAIIPLASILHYENGHVVRLRDWYDAESRLKPTMPFLVREVAGEKMDRHVDFSPQLNFLPFAGRVRIELPPGANVGWA